MKIRKRGQQYEISYRCQGYQNPFFERFPSVEAANFRIAQIEYEKSLGTFQPPKPAPRPGQVVTKHCITVSDLLDEYVQVYGLNRWGESYLSCSRHRIDHYIKPYLGHLAVKDLTTYDLDLFYATLQDTPAIVLKGHTRTDATVSPSVIERIHALLRSALNQAVIWGYATTNVANHVSLPKYKTIPRSVWSTTEAQTALSCCSDPVLKLTMLLALGCSMRIGEILGLTWDCVDISTEHLQAETASVSVSKELMRCKKDSIAALGHRGRSDVLFTFPEQKQSPCSTSLVLKLPKTESSIRSIFLPNTVALALLETKMEQDRLKTMLGNEYADYGLVIAHQDGRPYEARQISNMLKEFIKAHDLKPVVFHSLRHCSTSLKLQIGHGNIKAVQGDTGHAQARMVTDQYGHTHNEDRQLLARKVDKEFFQRHPSESKKTEADEAALAYQLLQNNPNIAKLIIATLGAQSTS